MSINRSDLVEKLLIKFSYLSRNDARVAIDVFFDTILSSLHKDKEVTIRGFGTFYNKRRRKAIARNPRTGQLVEVPERQIPAFRAGKLLISKINKK